MSMKNIKEYFFKVRAKSYLKTIGMEDLWKKKKTKTTNQKNPTIKKAHSFVQKGDFCIFL